MTLWVGFHWKHTYFTFIYIPDLSRYILFYILSIPVNTSDYKMGNMKYIHSNAFLMKNHTDIDIFSATQVEGTKRIIFTSTSMCTWMQVNSSYRNSHVFYTSSSMLQSLIINRVILTFHNVHHSTLGLFPWLAEDSHGWGKRWEMKENWNQEKESDPHREKSYWILPALNGWGSILLQLGYYRYATIVYRYYFSFFSFFWAQREIVWNKLSEIYGHYTFVESVRNKQRVRNLI